MRVAVIGAGVIGKTHIKVLSQTGEELVAVCDVDKEKLSAYPDVARYENYLTMLDEVRPDAVHICTPHYLHAEMVINALRRNIHVLCEKPLCIKEEDVDRILEAEKNSAAQLGVCFQHRFDLSTIWVKRYLQGKEIVGAHGMLSWHRDKTYYDQAKWRGTRAFEGGGVLVNQAIHTLDLLQYLVGMPQDLVAWCANVSLQNVIEVEDTATLVCHGKTDFSLSATNAAAADFPAEVTVKTKDDVLRLRYDGVFVNDTYYDRKNMDTAFGKAVYGNGHAALIRDFYDCVGTGRKFSIDGAEGAKAVRLVLAAYRSNGTKVRITDKI